MTFVPRQHQIDGCTALINHDGQLSVAEVAVAGGKSNMLGMLASYYMQHTRVMVVAHKRELVEQNTDAMRKMGIQPGICSSSIGTNAFARVTVGTIGTIINRMHLFRDVGAILVDEAHLVPPDKSSQYRRLFAKLPHSKGHGLTGTPFRADGSGDLSKTFGPCVYRYTFLDALRDGYVKPIVPVDAGEDEQISVEGLTSKGQDYTTDELDIMASRAIQLVPSHVRTVIDVMRKFGRRRVLVFACNIKHVDELEKAFKAAGCRVAGVHSQSIVGKRDKAVEAFRAGAIDILVSCNMFTTGFNVEDIDYIAFCRATKSAVLYAQGLGRGARLTPYAANCLLSDFGGNINRHGTLDAVAAAPGRMLTCEAIDPECGQEWETWEHGKTCPKCHAIHKSAPKCKQCFERFDPFFHGLRCPHCGTHQNEVKKCAACENTYAAFLHPICPFCQYDNTINRDGGKDMTTRGGANEAVNVKAFIEANPWQQIVAPPVRNDAGGWLLTTKFTTALWPYDTLPPPAYVFLKRANNGRYVVGGISDVNGTIHQK